MTDKNPLTKVSNVNDSHSLAGGSTITWRMLIADVRNPLTTTVTQKARAVAEKVGLVGLVIVEKGPEWPTSRGVPVDSWLSPSDDRKKSWFQKESR